ncbi:hypothetical protein MNBD_GAMMA18-147, partial [hydrothermal vent metagenome]
MGTDNVHHKRKAKQAKELARRKARRKPYDKVLIVCEGEKTEPNYFEELKDYYELVSANVEITGKCGSSPMSVVDYAQDLYREAKKAGDAFDKVFCVFDKDTHSDYQSALDMLNSKNLKGVYQAVPSVPCFEYWLLLHFTYTDKPFNSVGNTSVCKMVMHELNNEFWPDYQKAAHGVFGQRLIQLEDAKANAERALRAAQKNHTDNPSTRIHELVE